MVRLDGKSDSCADTVRLRQRFYQLSIAVEQSPAATAITDVHGRIEYVNRRFLEVTGYEREELVGRTSATVQSGHTPHEVYRDLWQTLSAGGVWRGELLNRRKSGELYWETEVITPVRNDDGEIVNFVAVKEDITERKRQEGELRLLATVFETAQATLIADAKLRIERVNQAFSDITGYREEEVLGKTTHIFRSDRHDRAFYARLWDVLLTKGHWQGEAWSRNKHGETHPFWQSVTAVRDAAGKIQHFVAVFHNITERKRMEHELERQATRDHLTGALNRRGFDAALRQAICRSEEKGSVFSLLLFDIDHFKAVNDRHGHKVGDVVLKGLVKQLTDGLRSTDILCRWGGEEFTILLLDTPLQGAATIAERMRYQVAASRYQGVTITISLGITEYRPGDDMGSLVLRTDQALYRAKAEGRDRLVIDALAEENEELG